MADAKLRELERQAAAGDPEAQEKLWHEKRRTYGGRHADKIGRWVVVDGVRDHYRGKLLHITELSAGKALLHLAPCYFLESLRRSSENEDYSIRCTEDHPFDLSSEVVGGLSLQPESWPES